MKRKIISLVTLAVFVLTACAVTANALVGAAEYTDVPTVMTQGGVISLEANEDCAAEALQPDEESRDLLNDVYEFVYKEENRPASYYDELTQETIQTLCGDMDTDALHMTEAMRLQLAGEPEDTVAVEMKLDVDYVPGQLVVVVLGIPGSELEYSWYPYRAVVPENGVISWEIPVEDWELLSQQPVSFHALTVRTAPGGESAQGETASAAPRSIFSKDSGDVYSMQQWSSQSGETIDDDFRVYITDLTEPMQQEITRIGEHVAEDGLILDYFPDDWKAEALLMLPDEIDETQLVAYDVIALRSENYKDTYADINVDIQFGTAYDTEKSMVVLAGFENKDAQEAPYMEWHVLRTEALQIADDETATDVVRIGLKQLNLPYMEEEPMMLVVISEELEPQE